MMFRRQMLASWDQQDMLSCDLFKNVPNSVPESSLTELQQESQYLYLVFIMTPHTIRISPDYMASILFIKVLNRNSDLTLDQEFQNALRQFLNSKV